MSSSAKKIFISYKHNVEPDDALARKIYEELSEKHSVFRDREKLRVGEKWAQRIQKELSESDYMIALLSSDSLKSEMVRDEIERAHKYRQDSVNDTPFILPVRIKHNEPYDQQIGYYLNEIQWTFWHNEDDTGRLIDELEDAITNEAPLSCIDQPSPEAEVDANPTSVEAPHISAQIQLERPDGTMDAQSKYYVERKSDDIVLRAISRTGEGETISIKGPRQVGKSSLLMRIIKRARDVEKQVVFLDFQEFDKETLQEADVFFQRFCSWVAYKLDLENKVEEIWKIPLGYKQKCSEYFEKHILSKVDHTIVLAMDEVERMFDTKFRDEFFSMLRVWHNDRAHNDLWRKLDLVLVTSTEPYQLIQDLNQSPFNVGDTVVLNDFKPAHIRELNRRHGDLFTDRFIDQLYEYLHGHPFLTRKAMYLVADKQYRQNNLFAKAADDEGPFGDHLRYHLMRIYDKDDPKKQKLVECFKLIMKGKACTESDIVRRLKGAGLVREEDNKVVVRSKLYEKYFEKRLNG